MDAKENLKSVSRNIKTIYFDGTCPMCTAFTNVVEHNCLNNFKIKDITTTELPSGLTTQSVQSEIHVVDEVGNIHKNAQAILVILDEMPHWKRVTWVGRLPVIRSLLTIGYNIIARNRHFLFGASSRVWWLKTATIFGLVAGLLLSIPLWIRTGVFPSVALVPGLPILSPAIELILFLSGIFLLTASLLSVKPQRYLWGVFCIFLIFILFDQLRFQPWIYQYLSVLFVLGFYSWDWRDTIGKTSVLQTLRLLVAGIYIYSGLQKISMPFFTSVFPWMVEPITYFLPGPLDFLPIIFGLTVPFIEIAIGIGLLIRPWRNKALLGVFCMLAFVIFTLGPWGHNWNNVVWPWNITIALSAFILFYRTDDTSLRDIFVVKNFAPHKIILLLFIMLPSLSFIGMWDSYPAYSLYSGNVALAKIYYDNIDITPTNIHQYIHVTEDKQYTLDIQLWSYADRNVPAYPEVRVYKSIFSTLCEQSNNHSARLEIQTKATLFLERELMQYKCGDVRN